MTNEDIVFIERELMVVLPESYKCAVVPFRIPALIGNTDYELWDDAASLVELNREFRAGSRWRPPLPSYLFVVGDPHGDEIIAMDIRSPEGSVWWLDHGMIDHEASYQSHARFLEWAEEFYRDIRHDLEADGFNPDVAPEIPKKL